MSNDKELRPEQPGDDMELIDDELLEDVAGGGDKAEELRWCPQRPGKPHTWERCSIDFMYSYYRCKYCFAEAKKAPDPEDAPMGTKSPMILMRPGRRPN